MLAETEEGESSARWRVPSRIPVVPDMLPNTSRLEEHIQEVKALANPPAGVRLACEGVCIMPQPQVPPCVCWAHAIHVGHGDRFQLKPVKKPDPSNPSKKIEATVKTMAGGLLSLQRSGLLGDFAEAGSLTWTDCGHVSSRAIKNSLAL